MVIYILLILGIAMTFGGYMIHRRQIQLHKESFQEMVQQEQEENSQHIEYKALYQEIISKLSNLEDKMGQVMDKIEHMNIQDIPPIQGPEGKKAIEEPEDMGEKEKVNLPQEKKFYTLPKAYQESIDKIRELKEKDYTIEEIATSLDMGKGEVLFLQNLLKK